MLRLHPVRLSPFFGPTFFLDPLDQLQSGVDAFAPAIAAF
jgi:hypothetical protein